MQGEAPHAPSATSLEERAVPHIIIKALEGKSDDQKARLTESIVQTVMAIFGNEESAVSVAIEEIAADRWKDEVYLPDIKGRPDTLYKKPGYEM